MNNRALEIVAHRGYSAIAPENTRPAFLAALEHHAHSVEFDVQLSADRIPVIFHDVTLDRTAGISGNLGDYTLVQLQQLEIGAWFHPQFAGAGILTLAETLEILEPIEHFIYLDVKPHCHWQQEDIEALIELLQTRGWQQRSILCSFSDCFLQQIRDCTTEFTIGYSIATAEQYLPKLEQAAADGNAVTICEYNILLDRPDWVQKSRNLGVDAIAWTVDVPEDRDRLIALGVDRIITNSLFRTST
jgi:glycerophosphoryl diester phosphodiesterase